MFILGGGCGGGGVKSCSEGGKNSHSHTLTLTHFEVVVFFFFL